MKYYAVFNIEKDKFLGQCNGKFYWTGDIYDFVACDLNSVYGHTLLTLGGYIKDDGYFKYNDRLYRFCFPHKNNLLLPIIIGVAGTDFTKAFKL